MAQAGDKRNVEGLAVGPGRYRVTEEEIKERNFYTWRVDPGVDLNRDSVWEMNMIIRHDQLVRFPPECMFIKFTAKAPNKDFIAGGQGAEVTGKYVRLENAYTMPQEDKPAVFFDGCVGASAIFSGCEVLVNGVPVPDTQGMSSFQFVYAAINKIYCTEKHRREKYLREIYRVSTDGDGTIPQVPKEAGSQEMVPGDHPPDMDACMELLQFDDQAASNPKLGRFTMDVSSLALSFIKRFLG